MNLMPMHEIKRRNEARGHYFFSPDSMRFFRSRTAQYAYSGEGGIYFVTSEQFVGSDGYKAPRTYTVRKMNEAGEVDTVGDFNKLSRSAANRIARKLAQGA